MSDKHWTNEEIEREAEKVVLWEDVSAKPPRLARKDTVAGITALGCRIRDEAAQAQKEADAKICDAVNIKYETGAISETDRWKDTAAETALECAAAIRTQKEG